MTHLYLTIDSEDDCNKLQTDLLNLEKWESSWSMECNADKCEIIRITKKKNTILYPYKLHGELRTTEQTKYFGVTIGHNLNWKSHINNIIIYIKSMNTLRFIKRNINTSNKLFKETAYKTYVRPQIEYCNTSGSRGGAHPAADLWFFNAQNSNFSHFFLRSRLI